MFVTASETMQVSGFCALTLYRTCAASSREGMFDGVVGYKSKLPALSVDCLQGIPACRAFQAGESLSRLGCWLAV